MNSITTTLIAIVTREEGPLNLIFSSLNCPWQWNITGSTIINGFRYIRKFSSTSYSIRYNEPETVKQRDHVKQLICSTNGITLITVPFWWDKTTESVAHTIAIARPDIEFPSALLKGNAILTQMPEIQHKGSVI